MLIVQESILRFPGIEDLLNQRLQRLLKGCPVGRDIEIGQLAVIDLDTLEQMKPALIAGRFTLESSLNARATADPNYRQFWLDFLNYRYPGFLAHGDVALEQKFNAIFDRTRKNVFGA